MPQRFNALDPSPSTRRFVRTASATALTVATLATLGACGGGGGGDGGTSGPPTVASTSIATTTIDQPAIITVVGTNLSASSISVSSPGCASVARLTAAPHASTSTTAYYQCGLSAYAGTVAVAGSGTTLGTATFSLPVPTVTNSSITSGRYGASVLLTIGGTALDDGLVVSSLGCKNVTRLTTAPNISTATTAYYQCTASGAYSSTIPIKTAVGTILAAPILNVPAPIVTMALSGGGVSGNLVINLKGDKAPITVDNFLAYVQAGYYNGLIFHRVAPGFVVQGGGYGTATSGTLPTPKTPLFDPITLETTGGSNVQWTVAMARTSDPNSATSQFFVNLVNNASVLDSQGYAVFGDVTASASVVQAIAGAPCTPLVGTGLTDGSCVPIPNVVITSATQTQ
ncbi:MAG: peptidylprolyl isomerase [Betaproteobacteria bacterium]